MPTEQGKTTTNVKHSAAVCLLDDLTRCLISDEHIVHEPLGGESAVVVTDPYCTQLTEVLTLNEIWDTHESWACHILVIHVSYTIRTWVIHDGHIWVIDRSHISHTRFTHNSYMCHTQFIHGSYTIHTWVIHNSYMSHTQFIHGPYTSHKPL